MATLKLIHENLEAVGSLTSANLLSSVIKLEEKQLMNLFELCTRESFRNIMYAARFSENPELRQLHQKGMTLFLAVNASLGFPIPHGLGNDTLKTWIDSIPSEKLEKNEPKTLSVMSNR